MKVSTIIPENQLILHGNLLQVCRPQEKQRGGGLRGLVKIYSPQSQSRLVSSLLTLDWQYIAENCVARFVTLTTPLKYRKRLPFVYQALDKLRREMVMQGMLGAYVRKEYGNKRGMLHYHLIVFIPRGRNGSWLPEDPEEPEGWITRAWSDSLQYRGRVRVTSEVPEHWEAVKKYITKYCSKTAYENLEKQRNPEATVSAKRGTSEANTGASGSSLSKSHNAEQARMEDVTSSHNGRRFWYIWGKENLPYAKKEVISLDRQGLQFTYKLKRVMRKIIKKRLERSSMRRELKDRGKYQGELTLEDDFFYWVGHFATKHIKREVSSKPIYLYIKKGWFMGWRLWMNESDLLILHRLIQTT